MRCSEVPLRRIPLLMLAPEDSHGGFRRFYELSTDNTRQILVPDAATMSDSRCLSSHGWLLTCSRRFSMSLVNPFTHAMIPLPDGSDGSLNSFEEFVDDPMRSPEFVTKKLALSAKVETENYCVAIIYGNINWIALWRNGDDTWTKVVVDGDKYCQYGYVDIVYYKGEFYVIDWVGQVIVIRFDHDLPEVPNARIVTNLTKFNYLPDVVCKLYLVVFGEKLLLAVLRNANRDEEDIFDDGESPFYNTVSFVLFGLNDLEKDDAGVELFKDLGDELLFLGANQSISIKVSDCPGLKANCIYFGDDGCEYWPWYHGAGNDMGVKT